MDGASVDAGLHRYAAAFEGWVCAVKGCSADAAGIQPGRCRDTGGTPPRYTSRAIGVVHGPCKDETASLHASSDVTADMHHEPGMDAPLIKHGYRVCPTRVRHLQGMDALAVKHQLKYINSMTKVIIKISLHRIELCLWIFYRQQA